MHKTNPQDQAARDASSGAIPSFAEWGKISPAQHSWVLVFSRFRSYTEGWTIEFQNQQVAWRINLRLEETPLKLTTSIGSPQRMADWNLPQKPRKVGESRPFGQRCRRQRTESWPKTIKPANPTTISCSFFQASEEFIPYIVNLL